MNDDNMRFRVMQDGMVVASCEGPALIAMGQAAHYMMVYGQDGPCKLQWYTKGKRWKDSHDGELESAIAFRRKAIRQATVNYRQSLTKGENA